MTAGARGSVLTPSLQVQHAVHIRVDNVTTYSTTGPTWLRYDTPKVSRHQLSHSSARQSMQHDMGICQPATTHTLPYTHWSVMQVLVTTPSLTPIR
jgi:hypothetical protein